MIISGAVAAGRLQGLLSHDSDKASPMFWVVFFLVFDVFVGISVAALAITQASQVILCNSLIEVYPVAVCHHWLLNSCLLCFYFLPQMVNPTEALATELCPDLKYKLALGYA